MLSMTALQIHVRKRKITKITLGNSIVFVWSRNGANRTKAFVKGLLVPEMKIVGGATC